MADDDVDYAINQFMNKSFNSTLPDGPEKYDVIASRARAQALISARDLFSKTFGCRIAEANRQCNVLLPIYQLPEEVVATIISFTMEGLAHVPHNHYYKRLQILARVSRDWKRLVFNTPSLWTYLHSEMNPILMRTALRKAKSSAFIVAHLGGRGPALEPFLEVVRPLVGKLRILRWTLQSPNDPSKSILERPAPQVEKVELVARGGFPAPIDLFNGNAPRLSAIKLSSFPILWTSSTLCGLRSLELLHITSLGPSMGSVFNILSSCPLLAMLGMDNVELTGPASEASLSTPIELLHLVDIQLTNMAGDVMHHLLSGLRLPNCENIVVRCYMDETAPDTVLGDSLDPLVLVLEKALPVTSMVHFTIGEGIFEISVPYKTRNSEAALVCFKMTGASRAVEAFQWFFACVGPLIQTRPVSILLEHFRNLSRDVKTSRAIATLFDQLPGTVELKTRVRGNIMSIIRALSNPIEQVDTLRWRLPEMHTLDIGPYDKYEAATMVQMARSRYGLVQRGKKGKKKKQIPASILPVQLQRLAFSDAGSMNATSYERLQDIVGGEIVRWDFHGVAEGMHHFHPSPMDEDFHDFADFDDDWEMEED